MIHNQFTQTSLQKLFVLIGCLLAIFAFIPELQAQTIREKKEGLTQGSSDLDPQSQEKLKKINAEITQKQDELHHYYAEVALLYKQEAPEHHYQDLLVKINDTRDQMDTLNHQWREGITRGGQDEGYGLWYQPDTTIEQLVIDYGSQDYVYMIPPEIAGMKLSVASNLPVPRSSWSEMLELILMQNGVGIEQMNPYLRRLYLLSTNQSAVKLITNRKQDLVMMPPTTRVSFVLSPEASEVRRIWFFLDKFVNRQSTVLQLVGRDILIIGCVAEVQDLLKLYDFAEANKGDKDYRLVSLARISAEEMAKILGAIFDQNVDHHHPRPMSANAPGPAELQQAEGNGLRVLILGNMAQAIFLVGTKEELNQAEDIIREVDGQLGDVREKVIYWYTAKNSSAEDIAEVLSKIYTLMVQEKIGPQERPGHFGGPVPFPPGPPGPPFSPAVGAPVAEIVPLRGPDMLYHESFYQDGNVAVNPAPVTLVPIPREYTDDDRHNFIVDVKTNSIVMVVEAEILPKLKELLKKLDVPKKMVQIEVLLFEKRLNSETHYGLNLLRIGATASNTNKTGFSFNDIFPIVGGFNPLARGLTSFMFSQKRGDGLPAFDFTYNFLLSQQDVQINACPSIVTMNQTPAKLAIVEELSINTGVFEVETAKGVTLKDAFTRAQYGITLEITPTIHMRDQDDEYYCDEDLGDYITLETIVNFDTVHPDHKTHDRPPVTRRNIVNEVIIPDGQTVILGGLRRKNTHDCNEAIPFIGELPGIGKLFSNTSMEDSSTEMFIFITPRIINDPACDIEKMRAFELCRRPGDIPEFLCCLERARELERTRAMTGSLKILLGRTPERCFPVEIGEYDGR